MSKSKIQQMYAAHEEQSMQSQRPRVCVAVYAFRRLDVPWPDVPFYASIPIGMRPVAADCEQRAEQTRKDLAQLYGGQWIVIRHWEQEKYQARGVQPEHDVDYVDRSQLKPISELRRLRLQAATQNDAPEHWEFG